MVNPIFPIQNRIKNIVKQAVNDRIIDSDTQSYLMAEFSITPVIYILPKILKNVNDHPGHPIVSSTESATAPLAIYLDKSIAPSITQNRSYIQDSYHFLVKMYDLTVTTVSFLVTWFFKFIYSDST